MGLDLLRKIHHQATLNINTLKPKNPCRDIRPHVGKSECLIILRSHRALYGCSLFADKNGSLLGPNVERSATVHITWGWQHSHTAKDIARLSVGILNLEAVLYSKENGS